MEEQENVALEVNCKLRFPARKLSALAVAVISLLGMGCVSKQEPVSVNDLHSLTLSKLPTANYIDSINGISDLTHRTARVPRGDDLIITGWAVDSITKQPAKRVLIDLDGKLYATQYGTARPDVVAVFKESTYTATGFTATVPNPSGEGEHRVTLEIVSSDGSTYYTGMSVAFVLQ
jgi:hypothetical protein